MTAINLAKVTLHEDGNVSCGHNTVGPMVHQLRIATLRLRQDSLTGFITVEEIIEKWIEIFGIVCVAHSPVRNDHNSRYIWVVGSGLSHPIYSAFNYVAAIQKYRPRTHLDTAINFTAWSMWCNLGELDILGLNSLQTNNWLQRRTLRYTEGYIIYCDPHYGTRYLDDKLHNSYWGGGDTPSPENSVISAAFGKHVKPREALDVIFDAYIHYMDNTAVDDKEVQERRSYNKMRIEMWRNTALGYRRGSHESKLILHPQTTFTTPNPDAATNLRKEFPNLKYVHRSGRDITIGVEHDNQVISVTFDLMENLMISMYQQLAPNHEGLQRYIDYICARYDFIKWHRNASKIMSYDERMSSCPRDNLAYKTAMRTKGLTDRTQHLFCLEPLNRSRFLKILEEYDADITSGRL